MKKTVCILLFLIAGMSSAKDGGKPPDKTCEANTNACCYKCETSSAPITINVSPSQTLENKSRESDNDKPEKSEWERWTGIGTVALAFFTMLLAAFSLWQRYDLKKASKIQLRAYVGVTAQEISWGDKLVVIVEYGNKGSTPAHDVDLRISAKIFEYSITPTWEVPGTFKDEGKGGVILPGTTWERRCEVDGSDAKSTSAILEKKVKVWVWGTIRYTDIFGDPCYVQFRFQSSEFMRNRREDGTEISYFALIPDIENTKAIYGKKA